MASKRRLCLVEVVLHEGQGLQMKAPGVVEDDQLRKLLVLLEGPFGLLQVALVLLQPEQRRDETGRLVDQVALEEGRVDDLHQLTLALDDGTFDDGQRQDLLRREPVQFVTDLRQELDQGQDGVLESECLKGRNLGRVFKLQVNGKKIIKRVELIGSEM